MPDRPSAARFVQRLGEPRDRRSIGRSEEVVDEVLDDPGLFPALFEAMTDRDPIVRMRAADATEKVTRVRPELLDGQLEELLGEVAATPQKEVRWHVAQLLGRARLSGGERHRAVEVLVGYLDDGSSIVKTFAMQALADLAEQDDSLHERVVPLLEELTRTGTPAMRARGRRLLSGLGKQG